MLVPIFALMDKIHVAILFGGRSTEHEISLLSAQNVIKAIDKSKYEPVLIGIGKNGTWYYQEDSLQLLEAKDPQQIAMTNKSNAILFSQNTDDHYITSQANPEQRLSNIDVIWPVLHGNYGEDGSIQGLAKIANLPCVGPGILGSAVGMDKEVMKRLLHYSGIDSAKWITVRRKDKDLITYQEASSQLGNELFIKPVNLGSSVGITFVKEESQFRDAIEMAFLYDNKVIIEERILGREIECAVLGNDDPIASVPGEVIPKGGFYSFESKYIDESGAALQAPADLTPDEVARVQAMAKETFICLECQGLSRVDMFLTPEGRLLINEINTLPGFTDISMYPTLWKLSGIEQTELTDRLIQLAIEAHASVSALKQVM